MSIISCRKLTLVALACSVIFQGTLFIGVSKAQAFPPCFIEGQGGTVANVGLAVGDLCVDGEKVRKLKRACVRKEGSIFDFSRCFVPARKKEIEAALAGSRSPVKDKTTTNTVSDTSAGRPRSKNFPPCYLQGQGGQVANVRLAVGSLCSDGSNIKKLKRECKSFQFISSVDFRRCLVPATKKDMEEFAGAPNPMLILRDTCPKLANLIDERSKPSNRRKNKKAKEQASMTEDLSECVISRTLLPEPETFEDRSTECLERMAQTCFDELDRLKAERNPDCVECNMRSPAGN
jgi:hypothetical protein